jgi:hypothetical protein
MRKKRNRKRNRNSRQKSRRVRINARSRKSRNRQYVAKADSRLRMLLIPKPEGVREVAIRGSERASQVGKFWAAVQKYLQTGDHSALLRFKGKSVTDASGKQHLFLADLKQLDRQASAGVLSFESIYSGGGR